jgi:two-component system, OmpR family, alkaline phosphatase synthesis response regulator PhoP
MNKKNANFVFKLFIKMQKKLLIVDVNNNQSLIDYLAENDFITQSVKTLSEAIFIIDNFTPDIVLVDLMNEEPNGIEVFEELKKLKKLTNTIFSFFTEKNDDYLTVMALNMGADDFIIKPIRSRLLLSKLVSLLRRYVIDTKNLIAQKIEIENLIIDHETYQVTYNDIKYTLTKKEFELLLLLASKNGKVLTREQIIIAIWGEINDAGNRTIDVHIRRIREKIKEIPLKTIKGVGYKMDM